MHAFSLREDRFQEELRRLIALTPRLQNNPGAGLVPEERLAAQVVLDTLAPHLAGQRQLSAVRKEVTDFMRELDARIERDEIIPGFPTHPHGGREAWLARLARPPPSGCYQPTGPVGRTT